MTTNRRPGWNLIPGDWVQLNRIVNELGTRILVSDTPLWDLIGGNVLLHSGSLVLPGLTGVLKATTGVVSGSATTSDLPEGTNLYYTDTRSRAAVSESVTGLDYSSSTGVLSLTTGYVIPTTTEESNWNAASGASHAAVTLATSADVLLGLTGQALSFDTQVTKYVLIGPASGADAAPTFRALLAADIPALAYEASGSISSHAALTTGVHGLAITAGQTLTVTTGGTLGSAAYTATTAYDAAGVAAGAVSSHAALTTGIHGLAITAGQTLTVTTGGTLGSAAYTASTAYDAAGVASGAVSSHAALTTGIHGLLITAGQTLTVTTGGTLGSAAYTATSAYDAAGVAAGAVSSHASLTTGIHGLAITAGQTLTVTTGGTLGSAAYTASTAYDVAGAAAAVTPATLGLVIGTNTQAHSATLDAITAGTWTGATSITTLGTISTGEWNATAIADGKIASALTGKSYNSLSLTAAPALSAPPSRATTSGIPFVTVVGLG